MNNNKNNDYMNKSNLEKLSKSQIIELLLKQQKPKKVAKLKREPFDLESAMKDMIARNKKINKESDMVDLKYTKTVKSDREIYKYPMREASLGQYRKDELKKSSESNKTSKSFVKLFKKRISGLFKKKQPVTIAIRAKIAHVLRSGYETVTDHNFGSFEVKMPVGLSLKDTYKFALSTLMKSNITLLSGESITDIGFDIINLDKKHPIKTRMGSIKLESYLLNKQRPITKHGVNTCVIDYVWDQVRDKRGFKTYTRQIEDEIYKFVFEGEMINTEELINWAKNCHTNVSVHAFDARYRKFITNTNNCSDISLVYLVKDNHCYPITDEKLKLVASKANQGGCNDLLKYMSDMKWRRRHVNVIQMDSIHDIYEMNKENHIIVIPEGVNMREAINRYCENNKYYVEYLHWNNNGTLDGFIDHNKNMYLLNDEYNIRKRIYNKLFNRYRTEDFVWSNQSYTSIAMSLFAQQYGYIPESSSNIHAKNTLDEYYPRALQWCSTEDIPDDVVSIDISKCYPSIFLNNIHQIPIYMIHDVIEPFGCKRDLRKWGEFYIDETILYNYGSPIVIEAGFYSSNLISYLVEELNMPTKQIKYKITTKKALKPDTFKAYFKFIFDNFPENEAKRLANSFIGHFGMKYDKTNQGFTCTSHETALCCWTLARAEGKNVTVEEFNGIFMVREQSVERKFSDHTSINRFVVSEAILRCLQLISDCYGKNSVLYGYNTDGIYITNPTKKYDNKKDIKFSTKKIGMAFVTDSVLVYFEKHYRENMIELEKVKIGEGVIYNGQAGSGKTTKLCEMMTEEDDPIVLSFTNKAVENVKNRLKNSVHNWLGFDSKCHTFDSYFCDWHGRSIDSLEGKTVFIEEFSMVPNKWMTMIYKAFVMFGIKIYMFGDPNQCSPVEGGSQIHYDYLYSETVKQMCPGRETLEYIEKSCRYDKKTHEILNKFLKHGKESYHFNSIDQQYYKNICYLNKTRIEVNTKCCHEYVKDKKYEIIKFKYNGNIETYKVCIGMPVLATANIKDKEIFNTMEFVIEDINDINFKINSEWYCAAEFSNNFIPSFCVTVYKYQGADIHEPYNIYDVNRMDKKQFYTALSRTTKLDYIHLNNDDVNCKYIERRQPLLELMNARFNSLYKKGKIYSVTFDDGKIYVGSTCEKLKTRLSAHLSDP